MGGQGQLLVARWPHLLAGAAALDPRDGHGSGLPRLGRADGMAASCRHWRASEIGGTLRAGGACLRGAEPGPLRGRDRAVGRPAPALWSSRNRGRPGGGGGANKLPLRSTAPTSTSGCGTSTATGATPPRCAPTGGCRARSRASPAAMEGRTRGAGYAIAARLREGISGVSLSRSATGRRGRVPRIYPGYRRLPASF